MRELDGVAEGQRGSVAVAASMTIGSYLLPPILSEFRQRRPASAITLTVSDPEHALEAVELGECDFALVVAELPPVNPSLAAEVIGADDIVLVAAPDYEPGVASLPLASLAQAPLVSSPGGHVRRGVIDGQLAVRGVSPRNVVIELGHPEAMKRATREGLGMCLLFRASVAQELEDGTLREVAISDAELSVPLTAVVRSGKRLSPIQAELLAAVTSRTRGREHVAVA
jgi:LysR family transcriptional regulator, low CO2-responsive transcriptional regulator